jgi:hypothetical protein
MRSPFVVRCSGNHPPVISIRGTPTPTARYRDFPPSCGIYVWLRTQVPPCGSTAAEYHLFFTRLWPACVVLAHALRIQLVFTPLLVNVTRLQDRKLDQYQSALYYCLWLHGLHELFRTLSEPRWHDEPVY